MVIINKKTKNRTPRQSSTNRLRLTTYYRAETLAEPSSPFNKKPPPKDHRWLLGVLDMILLLVLLGGLIYSLLLVPQPAVIASSTAYHTSKQYESAAAKLLSAIKNRNKLTFSDQALTTSLQKLYPEISQVQTELPVFSQRPTVRLTVSAPALNLNSRGTNYIVDMAGVVVARAADLPRFSQLPKLEDQSGYRADIGQPVLSSDAVSFVKTVVAECQRAKVPISSMTLPAIPQEMDLRMAGKAYYVKFFLGGDALEQTGQFLAARQHFSQAGPEPSSYLDVRIPGKIFYK